MVFLKMPKIKPHTLTNTIFFWARQVPTFPVHHLLVGPFLLYFLLYFLLVGPFHNLYINIFKNGQLNQGLKGNDNDMQVPFNIYVRLCVSLIKICVYNNNVYQRKQKYIQDNLTCGICSLTYCLVMQYKYKYK
jgi:hypothetical protein